MRMPSGRTGTVLFALILAVIWILIVGAAMLNADHIYGDWTCAFAHCAEVRE